jgi:hypothetical protein
MPACPLACYDQDMDWFPVVFIVFKVLVLGTGMFFAIKWHHDEGKKKKSESGNP